MTTDASFEALVAAHQRDVVRVCRAIVREEHLSHDAAQETFVRLWRRLRDGRAPDDSASWLRRVAIGTAIDVVRSRKSSSRGATSIDGSALDRIEASGTTPEAALDLHELESRFAHALTQLPEGQRTIFLLRHEGGLSLAEIAASLDLALPTVKTQFARAALRLQTKLAPFRPVSPADVAATAPQLSEDRT